MIKVRAADGSLRFDRLERVVLLQAVTLQQNLGAARPCSEVTSRRLTEERSPASSPPPHLAEPRRQRRGVLRTGCRPTGAAEATPPPGTWV